MIDGMEKSKAQCNETHLLSAQHPAVQSGKGGLEDAKMSQALYSARSDEPSIANHNHSKKKKVCLGLLSYLYCC